MKLPLKSWPKRGCNHTGSRQVAFRDWPNAIMRNDRRSAAGSVPSGEGIVECFRELRPPQSTLCRLEWAGAKAVTDGSSTAGGSLPYVGLFAASLSDACHC
jgi:hypothetical protein